MKLAIRCHDLLEKDISVISYMLKNLDIDGVQLVCYKTFDDIAYESGQIDDDKALKIARFFKSLNKEIFLIGAYFNPVHSNTQKVNLGKQIFKEYLKFGNKIGCNTVGSETGSYNDDQWTYNQKNRTDEALEKVVNTFKELCDYAQEHNSYTAIEGAFGHICYDVKTLKRAVDMIDRKNLKVIFDIYNYLDISNHTDYENILTNGLKTFDKIHCFHLKDYIVQGCKLRQVPLGQGIMNYPVILKLIKDYDKDAVLVLEGTTGKNIEPAVKLIRKLWGKS